MKVVVIGSREDVAGFALAGLDGVVCRTRDEAAQELGKLPEETLVIVSDDVAPRGGRLAIALPRRT